MTKQISIMDYVEYDENSESFLTWKQPYGFGRFARHVGDTVGTITKYRENLYYYKFGFNRSSFVNHRVIWEIHNGNIPDGCVINHIDNNSLNNSISNLEVISNKANLHRSRQHNLGILNNLNKTGYLGISLREDKLKSGKVLYYVHAQYRDEAGKKIQKYFRHSNTSQSIQSAILLANAWRNENLQKLVDANLAFYIKKEAVL